MDKENMRFDGTKDYVATDDLKGCGQRSRNAAPSSPGQG